LNPGSTSLRERDKETCDTAREEPGRSQPGRASLAVFEKTAIPISKDAEAPPAPSTSAISVADGASAKSRTQAPVSASMRIRFTAEHIKANFGRSGTVERR
jgi:hypothetical protein